MQTRFEQEENSYKVQRVIEASLFMANKPLTFAELAEITKANKEEAVAAALAELVKSYEASDRAVEISINSETKTATMQIKAKWLPSVAQLAGKIELHRKSMKMLALIAKKGELTQSDLRKYFKGDIYEYVGELREKGYLERQKLGHSWKLKPTKKFHEEFQIAIGDIDIPEPTKEVPIEQSEEKSI